MRGGREEKGEGGGGEGMEGRRERGGRVVQVRGRGREEEEV